VVRVGQRVGQRIGAFTFSASGEMVLAVEYGFARWKPREGRLEPFGVVRTGAAPARFNDGAVDPRGRFWAGTLREGEPNSLHRLDPDGSVWQMDTGFGVSNDIGWSSDHMTMYFTDSDAATIYAYAFDVETGRIGNRRMWAESAGRPGVPVGLTVNAEGCVWNARWGVGCVERYIPAGELVETVRVPAAFPTSVTFSGVDLRDLYITSALLEVPHEERARCPLDGDLFRFRSGTPGQPEPLFGDHLANGTDRSERRDF